MVNFIFTLHEEGQSAYSCVGNHTLAIKEITVEAGTAEQVRQTRQLPDQCFDLDSIADLLLAGEKPARSRREAGEKPARSLRVVHTDHANTNVTVRT